MSTAVKNVTWEGEDAITTYTSSEWAERGFCSACGSSLFYRLTSGKYVGAVSIPLGALDDQRGFELNREWFIDNKPGAYSLEGERERLTEAEIFAKFAPT